jgi:hypothetical protein
MATLVEPEHVPTGIPLARYAVLTMAILQVVTPLLPSAGMGMPIGDRSDAVRTIITPADWAFTIWTGLYAGSFAFAIYQMLPAMRVNARIAALRWPVAATFLGNAGWAVYVQFFGLGAVSAAILMATLGCALIAFRSVSSWRADLTTGERWLTRLPLSALAAWLAAAAIVNIAASLRFHGVEAGEAAAAIGAAVVLIGGMIAGMALLRSGGNVAFAVVFLWALAAIFSAGGQQSLLVASSCALAALIVIAGSFRGRAKVLQSKL